MRTLLIFFIAFGILNGTSRASESDSLGKLDSVYVQGSWTKGCYDSPVVVPIEGKCPQPSYPQQALQDSVKGKVVVGVHVDSCGLVKEWKVFQEKPEGKGFAKEVEKVIPHWEFLPPLQQGHPTDTWIAIPFNFKPPKPDK